MITGSANTDETKEEGEDIISQLPDSLLTQILSLLPDQDANRTRILSNRWQNLWALLPNLHFVMPISPNAENFHDDIDRALALRAGMPIRSFVLYCAKNCNYDRVHDTLCIVVGCKLEKLDISFPADRFVVRFCWDLFRACSTLVELTLKGEFVLDVPESEVLFPCLKKMNLVSVVYSCDQTIADLISGCPVLEELCVERQVLRDNLTKVKIFSPFLKRLMILFTAYPPNAMMTVDIDAPKLEYLNIVDGISIIYECTSMSSLVEANLNAIGYLPDIITCSSSAKLLTLSYSALQVCSLIHQKFDTIKTFRFNNALILPRFPNLVKFVVCIDHDWDSVMLFRFLNNSPNVEHLTFSCDRVPFITGWKPPTEPPACLHFHMKEIIIQNRETVRQEDFTFIRYLLKNSNNLETFSINAHDIDYKKREELLKFHRGSISCCVKFV